MKNTLMFLLVSALLAFSLTACGGDGLQTGTNGNYGAAGQTDGVTGDTGAYGSDTYGNDTYSNGAAGYNGSAANGNAGYSGSAAYGANGAGDSLMDDARNALDDAGNAANRAANGF